MEPDSADEIIKDSDAASEDPYQMQTHHEDDDFEPLWQLCAHAEEEDDGFPAVGQTDGVSPADPAEVPDEAPSATAPPIDDDESGEAVEPVEVTGPDDIVEQGEATELPSTPSERTQTMETDRDEFSPGQRTPLRASQQTPASTQRTPTSQRTPAQELAPFSPEHMGWEDAWKRAKKKDSAHDSADPVKAMMATIKNATNTDALSACLYRGDLFQGFCSRKDCIKAIKARLDRALNASWYHGECTLDPEFDFLKTGPVVWMQAMKQLGLKEKLFPEALHLSLEAQLSFLENRKTRLLHRPDSKHVGVNPQTSAMIGLSPSSRKSHMVQRTNGFLTAAAPEDSEHDEIKAFRSKKVFVQEYTPKGFRTTLLNHRRVALYSDEAVNIFSTAHKDPHVTRQYADRAKLNTYLLGECDDMTTAAEAMHIGEGENMYVMSMKITGQNEVMEEAMAPQAHAFQKRCSMAWPPDDIPKDETVKTDAADDLVMDMHKFMFSVMVDESQPQKLHLDGFALDLYEAVSSAVEEWVAARSKHDHFTKFHRQKVEFYHTDTLRLAWLNMRKCQYLLSLRACPAERARTSPNLREFLMAVHAWLRQVDLHFAFYYYYRTVMRPMMAENKNGRASNDLHGSSGVVSAALPAFGPRDLLKRELLTNDSFAGPFDQKEVRLAIRNRGVMDACKRADTIVDVAQELVDIGLLEPAQAPAEEEGAAKRKKGRPIKMWTRRKLEDVTASADAERERKRLCVGKDCFG